MDEKISLEAIALYGDAYADKVLKGFFSNRETISGPEILTLCNVQQVNLFVIRELFKAWKEETRKQRSAYFNYDHPEVKEALNGFVTVLSNHIAVGKAHFGPMLKKATSQCLLVIFDPYDFFSMLISGKNNKLDVVALREEIKYLKINKAPLERMLVKLEERGVQEIPGNEAFAILDQILEEVNFTPEDLDDYITRFSEVLPLDPAKFYVAKPADLTKKIEAAPIANRHDKSTADNQTRTTLNEHLNQARQPAVADSLRKINKIKDHLTINQKFMFTKVLFYGDFDSFSRTVDEIDQLSDMNQALQYLEKRSVSWDRDSKEFHEFMEMVEKRFG